MIGGVDMPRERVVLKLLAVVVSLLPVALAAQSWQEPARGSAIRTALMDAIRPHVEWKLGAPVEFLVYDLRVAGDVAFANLYPQRPDGAAIDLYQTPAFRRGELDPQEIDGAGVQVLYRKTGSTWVALHWLIGAGDVWWSDPAYCPNWRLVIPEACQGF